MIFKMYVILRLIYVNDHYDWPDVGFLTLYMF
jgi:hypothetical protein